MEELESRARALNVYDLRPFYNSAMFRNHGLHLNVNDGTIVKAF
jgi:hypothetical protein